MATRANYELELTNRQEMLIAANVRLLRQALVLIEQLGDRVYSQPPPGFPAHRAGAHLRHVLEFYECFLDGVGSGHVDYDARQREQRIETDRACAGARIRALIDRLESAPELRGDGILWVRMEDAPEAGGVDPFLVSSPGRELQVLCSHTTHHFALMAMTFAAHGVPMDAGFGMAPSTLRYLASRGAAVDAAGGKPVPTGLPARAELAEAVAA